MSRASAYYCECGVARVSQYALAKHQLTCRVSRQNRQAQEAHASKIKQLKDEVVKYAALWSVDPYYEPHLREAILAFRVADTEEALRSLSVEGVE